jgi:two-component system response regulator FlrC
MSKPRALVVDDDAAVARVHARILQGAGYEVETVANGALALQALERASVAVVVSDMDMPGMDGLELLARMRTEHAHVPVVIVTGDARDDVVTRAMKHGAACCISKPVDPRVMVKAAADAVKLRANAGADDAG